jgi:hypothetical protein
VPVNPCLVFLHLSLFAKDQKRLIENEIQELRTKINAHLDKLQENLMKELTEADKHVTEETGELLVSLDEKQRVYFAC